ncbi:MAG: hypothetical protein WD396_10100 [Pseudohongiellaceae bacterium]
MNEQWRQQLNRLAKNIESRKQSEKMLVLGIVLVGLILSWLSLVSDPMTSERQALRAQISNTSRQIEAQQQAYTAMLAANQQDPDRFAIERLAVIEREQAQLDTQIANLAGDLVSPAQMTQILVDVLEQQSGLSLVSFRNLAATPLRTGVNAPVELPANGEAAPVTANITGQVYEHGLVLEFQGDFFDTLRYLHYLESMTGSFFWDSITFSRLDWPQARVSLQIHTLSTDQGFIGV